MQKDLKKGIKNQGYYEFHKDIVINQHREWLEASNEKSAHDSGQGASVSNANRHLPSTSSFTTERLSQTPKFLNNNQLYLVKTGGGNYTIFDMREFLPPFLSLYGLDSSSQDVEDLPVRLPRNGYRNLAMSFGMQWNEHTFIRALHFCGAFSALVAKITKNRTRRYVAGPSGPITTRFPFWMKSKTGRLVPFVHDGTADLDECLYPRGANTIIPIEAKLQHITDLSWHKLAFPCYRFINQPSDCHLQLKGEPVESQWTFPPAVVVAQRRKNIIPVYCAYRANTREALIYVFPPVQTYNKKLSRAAGRVRVNGVVLNESRQMFPEKIFKVDLSWV